MDLISVILFMSIIISCLSTNLDNRLTISDRALDAGPHISRPVEAPSGCCLEQECRDYRGDYSRANGQTCAAWDSRREATRDHLPYWPGMAGGDIFVQNHCRNYRGQFAKASCYLNVGEEENHKRYVLTPCDIRICSVPYARLRREILVAPKVQTSAPDLKYTPPVFCKSGFWPYGYKQHQQARGYDDAGLTKLELYCAPFNRRSAGAYWIGAGDPKFDDVEGLPKYCNDDRLFMTGIEATFGGVQLGITEVLAVCGVPNWGLPGLLSVNSTKPVPGVMSISIPAMSYTHNGQGRRNGWERRSLIVCPYRTAICGFSTRIDATTGPGTDDSGINEIKIYCCNFPS